MAVAMSRWRAEADRVIARVLESLPAGAAGQDRLAAVEAAYPFGPRQYLPYRHWRKAVAAAFGVPPSAFRPAPAPALAFTPREGLPDMLRALLLAVAADPAREAPRLILADWLQENGHWAVEARTPVVEIDRVCARAFGAGAHVGHVGHGTYTVCEVQGRHGGYICPASLVDDHIAGRVLLRVPDVARAVNVERAATVLSLFGEVTR